MAAIELKRVPAEAWATVPWFGTQIAVIDEANRIGFWNGSAYAACGGGVVEQNGTDYLVGSNGKLYPMPFLAGTYSEGVIAGAVSSTVLIDSGDDNTDHANILILANCTLAGNPELPDYDLAALMFQEADSAVTDTGLSGNLQGVVYARGWEPRLSWLIFAVQNATLKTPNTTTNVVGTTTMVGMYFPNERTKFAEIQVRNSVLAGTGYRTREIVVTPYLTEGA